MDSKASLEDLVQEVIDHAQYHDQFLPELMTLLASNESPFEVVDTDHGRIRRLKEKFQKTDSNANEARDSSESDAGDNQDGSV